MINMVRVYESEMRDFQRILEADQAMLELEKSPEKRTALHKEIEEMENKIVWARRKMEFARRPSP